MEFRVQELCQLSVSIVVKSGSAFMHFVHQLFLREGERKEKIIY